MTMIKLYICLLTLVSISSFAGIMETNATNDEIRDAVLLSLQDHDLNCVDLVNNETLKASTLMLARIFKEDYTLAVSADLSQPLITMEKTYRNNPKFKNVMTVTTDKVFQLVTKLTVKSYKNVAAVRVNVGSILNPVYKEEVITGKPFEDLVCE